MAPSSRSHPWLSSGGGHLSKLCIEFLLIAALGNKESLLVAALSKEFLLIAALGNKECLLIGALSKANKSPYVECVRGKAP